MDLVAGAALGALLVSAVFLCVELRQYREVERTLRQYREMVRAGVIDRSRGGGDE